MNLMYWLDKTLVVSRMAATSGDKIALSTVTAVKAHLQPIDDEKVSISDGTFGKSFYIWVDAGNDIQEGDRLKDESGNNYKVVKGGVNARSFGSISYIQILIEKTT